MVSPLYDPSIFKDHYGIGVSDGGKPVGNNEDCSAFHESIHAFSIKASVLVSIELVASSRIKTGGSATAALARAIL